jgi:uncharacterized protein
MKLRNLKSSQIVFEKLISADSFGTRAIGLIGKRSLSPEEAMFFNNCNAIHTCFMKISIDCVFLDKKGMIRKIYYDVKPWRFAGPVWNSSAVIEMAAGVAKLKNLSVGDLVECGP